VQPCQTSFNSCAPPSPSPRGHPPPSQASAARRSACCRSSYPADGTRALCVAMYRARFQWCAHACSVRHQFTALHSKKTQRSSLTLLRFCSCPTAIMCTAMVAPLRYSTFPFPIRLALRSHPCSAAFHPRALDTPLPSGLPPTRRKHILPPVRPACSAAPPCQRSKDMMGGECPARAPACAISKYSAFVSIRLCDNLRYSG